jgi:alanine racemase
VTFAENLSSAGRLTVDLDALVRNYRRLKATAAPSICAAVVKADAYGLGIAPVVGCLSKDGCQHFFVATLAEGLQLRSLLENADIFVFSGPLPGDETVFRAARLIPVLNSHEQVVRWTACADAERYPAIVHIDTGMTRLGLDRRELNQVALDSAVTKRLKIAYVMTHLACADRPGNSMNQEQLDRFADFRKRLSEAKTSIGNSAGLLMGQQFRGDLVRPGIALYGGNPFVESPNPVEPVVSLQAPILQIQEVTRPVTVGYGAEKLISAPARLATIGVGYADGIPRALGNKGEAYIAGQRVPMVGRVSMDLLSLDVTAVARQEMYPGACVELIGSNILLDDVAAAAGTIGYEILTGLGNRWERRYIGNGR